MKLLKKLGIFLSVAIALLLFVIAFAFESRSYQCNGTFSTEQSTQAQTLTMEILYYRDGIRLFSASDGRLILHTDSKDEEYFNHIKHIGYLLHIYDSNATQVIGQYSKIEKVLHLKTSEGIFKGECVEVK